MERKKEVIIALAEGRLKFSKKVITDGVDYFKVLSPALFIIMKHRNKRDNSICGRWIVINNKIVWFKKTRG